MSAAAAAPRVTVACGLLGAGKTTFVRAFAARLGARAVVLVNDFGEAGIDGEILAEGGLEAVELPSGCVCCTLRGELVAAIGRVLERFCPEHLLVEPSGVASPSGVLEALEAARLPPPTVVNVVDATEFAELHDAGLFGRFFEEQVAMADVVLVNKADLASPEAVEETVRRVAGINPGALVVRTVRAEVAEAVFPPGRVRRPLPRGGHLRFETETVTLAGGAPFAAVAGVFAEMAAGRYGEVARAKALVATDRGPIRFDLAGGRVESTPFERPVAASRIVVIGRGLDRAALLAALCDAG